METVYFEFPCRENVVYRAVLPPPVALGEAVVKVLLPNGDFVTLTLSPRYYPRAELIENKTTVTGQVWEATLVYDGASW